MAGIGKFTQCETNFINIWPHTTQDIYNCVGNGGGDLVELYKLRSMMKLIEAREVIQMCVEEWLIWEYIPSPAPSREDRPKKEK